ncbi:MAG: TolC family protein [Planctomycetota bacterium]|nr:TolC family protein [Planctomycetota bacterium]
MEQSTRRYTTWLILAAMGISSLSGCSRRFWRQQADKDTYNAIGEKLNDPRWELPRVNLTPDQRSRFYDPYDPDKEPLPPDDPAAHTYMHQVNGRRGYKNWHKLGTALAIENPQWLEPYGIEMNGLDPVEGHQEVKLIRVALPELVDLTYIHNRDYQTNLENLYLDALALTQQRYNLGVRFLGIGPGVSGGEPGVGVTAPLSKRGASGVSSQFFGVSQLLPAGGQMAVEVANSVTWAFGQSGSTPAPSIGYNITQPLLFNAGRKIALEPLTQAERQVLYDARTLARFRQTLFVQVSTSYLNLLRQRQTILNQINNIGQLQEQYEKQKALDSYIPDYVTERLKNFLEVLVIPDDMKVHFQYDGFFLKWKGNMTEEDQRRLLSLSDDEAYQSAIQQLIAWKYQDTTSLASYQLLNQLNQAQAGLGTNTQALADQQDALKILVGLPPNVQLEIDEDALAPFELISWDLIDLERRMRDIQKRLGEQLFPDLDEDQAELPPDFPALKEYLKGLAALRDELRETGLNVVQSDFQPVEDLLELTNDDWKASRPGTRYFRSEEERNRLLKNFEKDKGTFELIERDFLFGSDQLDMLVQLTQAETPDGMLKQLDSDGNGLIEKSELPPGWTELPRTGSRTAAETYTVDALSSEIHNGARKLLDDYMKRLAQQLEVLQAGLRVEVIALNKFTLNDSDEFPSIDRVVEIGLESRHDLMNSRAQVMDLRRKAEVSANALESTLNISFQGRSGLGGNNTQPINSATAQFTTPLDQIDERNAYNTALINYQRQRRAYMLAEDQIKQNVRQNWRQLKVGEYLLEIDRTTVRNAALGYDSASLQAAAANQGNALSLLQALSNVLNAQNSLVRDWIAYETNRLNIFQNMGIMQLDPRGVWGDPYYLQLSESQNDSEFVPPAMPPVVVPSNSQPQN